MLDRILLPSVIILFLIKVVALNLTDFNLLGDEAQYWLWSKDIDFGYFSKPPFLAWAIRVYAEIFCNTFVIFKVPRIKLTKSVKIDEVGKSKKITPIIEARRIGDPVIIQ